MVPITTKNKQKIRVDAEEKKKNLLFFFVSIVGLLK